ncbi:MAG: PH domain-containing protein, partial [Actinobacteria bacterium]|nr:PH domain-containing protein [Actinomycetota bacterium]
MQEPSASDGKRLSPAAILVWTFESIGRLGLAFLFPAFTLEGFARLLLLLAAAAFILPSVIRYFRFRYQLTADSLIVQGGLLFQWRRVIPLARVQSVEVVQKLRHRMFDVVELRVEAVGGLDTEAALVALEPAEAEGLRARLLDSRREIADEPEDAAPLAHLGPQELVLAGVTGGRVAVIAVLLGYAQELLPEERVTSFFQGVEQSGAPSIAIILGTATIILTVAVVISLIATVLTYWDFTVRREGERLLVTRGLLERRRALVPVRRIQAVELQENVLRRVFGLASLSVVLAGQAGQKDQQEETSMLLPVARRSTALDLASDVLGVPRVAGAVDLQAAPPRALVKRVIYACPVGIAAVVGALWARRFVGAAAPVTGVLVAVTAAAVALFGWRSLGHSVGNRHVIVRSGALVRRTDIVAIDNIQHLALTVSPPQRWLDLATLHPRIARGRPRAVDLDRSIADARFGSLSELVI